MTGKLLSTYAPLPVNWQKGCGVWLTDDRGRRFLDAVSGIAVCSLGHAHPALTEALHDQAQALWHVSNLYHSPWQEKLAEQLCAISDMERVFFCNSGTEANEAAIKLARLHGQARGIHSPVIIAFHGAFHGRSFGALSATGQPALQTPFLPMLPGFVHSPYGDLDALGKLLQDTPQAVAILAEPIQGENGVLVPDAGFLPAVAQLCQQHDCLLMLDEIQTGMCRTGPWFAGQHEAVQADVLTLAKALGNGFPVGACLARGRAASYFSPGHHGTTFGGNPLACRVASTVIDTMQQIGMPEQVQDAGQHLLTLLQQHIAPLDGVQAIRGRGLMLGIVMDQPCKHLAALALEHGLLINVTAERIIRLLPPLIINAAEREQLVHRLAATLAA